MAEKLSSPEIRQQLKELSGWELSENTIRKQYVFESFMPAIRFVNRIAELAEAADHHPDITINYRKVTLALSTHSAGGLTQKDFDLAKQAERIVKS
jgi:4a-hydroxytetrahydrobiopterin dehydratase